MGLNEKISVFVQKTNLKFYLFMIIPVTFYEKLEFDKVLELVQKHTLGEMGHRQVQKMAILTDLTTIQRLLAETNEYKTIIDSNQRFPISNYPSTEDDLRLLAIEGYVLPSEAIMRIAEILRIMRDIFRFFKTSRDAKETYPRLFDIIRGISFDEELLKMIEKVFDAEGNIRNDASPELIRIRRMVGSKLKERDQRFKGIINQYQSKGYLTETTESFRNGRRVLAVLAEYKRVVRGIIHDESATGKTTYIEPEEIIDINNDLFDLEQEEKREIYRILRDLCAALQPYANFIQQYAAIIVRYDVIQAKAYFARQTNAVMPDMTETPTIQIIKGYHPLLFLRNKKENKKTIPFSLTFYKENRLLILSGPNAGGKSICMKSVGLLQIMAQAGLLIPAAVGTELGIFHQFFADIGDQQSLEDDLSTYSSRIQLAKQFVEKADEKTLILIDEFGSGTDPKIGGTIAEGILKSLNERKVFGVITTHYSNLKIFAFKNIGIVNGAMIFDKDNLSPTYEMKVGKPGSSYAFEIAQKNGLQKQIVEYAKSKIGETERKVDELLVDLEKEKQEVQELRKNLENKQKQVDRLIKSYENLFSDLEIGRKKLKLQAKEQALADVHQENKELQKIIKELRDEQNREQAAEKAKELLKTAQEKKKELGEVVHKIKSEIHQKQEVLIGDKVQIGSLVRLLQGGALGKVDSLKGNTAEVVVGNMRLKVKLGELEPVIQSVEKPQIALVNTQSIYKNAIFDPKLDIRGMRYADALKAVETFMDEALLSSANQLRIIHGRGVGALRQATHLKLKEYRGVKYQYEDEKFGGDGVTIVDIA